MLMSGRFCDPFDQLSEQSFDKTLTLRIVLLTSHLAARQFYRRPSYKITGIHDERCFRLECTSKYREKISGQSEIQSSWPFEGWVTSSLRSSNNDPRLTDPDVTVLHTGAYRAFKRRIWSRGTGKQVGRVGCYFYPPEGEWAI